jgi:hypothetical protein
VKALLQVRGHELCQEEESRRIERLLSRGSKYKILNQGAKELLLSSGTIK